MVIIIFNLVMVALPWPSGLLGYEGHSHMQWKKVRGVFGKFCNKLAISIGLSLFGAMSFLLVVFAALHHHKKNKFSTQYWIRIQRTKHVYVIVVG